MRPVTVLHAVYSWLPVTQNWIYTQVTGSSLFRSRVLSMTEENSEQFPFKERSVAFSSGKISGALGVFFARYWLHQPHTFIGRTLDRCKPDLVHGHFSTESCRILCEVQKRHLPLVTTFYGLDVDKLSRRHRWQVRYLQLFRYGSAFTAEGPFMRTRIEALGCSREKIHVVPLGVPEKGHPVKEYTSKSPHKPVTILFTGLSREKKGPLDAADVFIAALQHFSDLQLSVIGDGCYRQPFEKKLKDAGVFERVMMHGYCSFQKYRENLGSADIVLVPSVCARDGDTEGGAPVVCIEAQLAGIPVVGTKHCDIPFVVHHEKGGFLSNEKDVAAMARAIVTLAQNADLRRLMGEYGRNMARRQHSVEGQIARLSEVYQQVLGENTDHL